MKFLLLLGKNDAVEEYAENVLQLDVRSDIVYYPDITTHHTELGQFIDVAREEEPPVITTQSLEMIDVFLESDLDFEIITVKKYGDEIKTRKKTKEELISLRENFDFDPRN